MQLKNFILAASAAATASAAACPAPSNKYFGLVTIHSGSAVHLQPFNAALSSIFAGLKSQNVSCDRPDEKHATFYLQDGSLHLYAASATPPGDLRRPLRHGPGQDRLHHRRSARPPQRRAYRLGHQRPEPNHLQFAGKDLIACPNSIDGAWSIWANAGVANPAGNKDCVSIGARVEETSNPNSCVYTQ